MAAPTFRLSLHIPVRDIQVGYTWVALSSFAADFEQKLVRRILYPGAPYTIDSFSLGAARHRGQDATNTTQQDRLLPAHNTEKKP